MFRIGLRILIAATGLGFLALTAAFYLRWPVVANFWPWEGPYSNLSPLSYYFLSSVAAAICAPLLWIAVTDKLHAAAAGALDLLVSLLGITAYIFQGYARTGNPRLLQAALLGCGSLALLGVLYGTVYKLQGTDERALPRPVLYSFSAFALVLLSVGSLLILNRPDILPWRVSEEASVVYGWIFLGASVYFLYAVAKPTWENATGPLLGFLAYDVILILPFLRQFSEVPQRQLLSLTVYTSVVVYSGILAVYYLLIYPKTRWRP